MFLYRVEVKVATNPGMGMGLFVKEFIPKGSIVWEFVDGVDLKIPLEKINQLHPVQREHFEKYGWIENAEKDFYYMSCDLTSFINHSFNPNVEAEGMITKAIKDINIGDEVFIDYSTFSSDFDANELSL